MLAVFGIGIVLVMGMLTGFLLVVYYFVLGALKLAGLSRERRIKGLNYYQVQAQDEWWATLSRADRKAWNAKEGLMALLSACRLLLKNTGSRFDPLSAALLSLRVHIATAHIAIANHRHRGVVSTPMMRRVADHT